MEEGRKKRRKKRGRYGNEKKNLAFFRLIFYLDHFLKSLLNLLQYYFYFMLWFFYLATKHVEMLAPQPGTKPKTPALEGEVLTIGLLGKLPINFLKSHWRMRKAMCFESVNGLWPQTWSLRDLNPSGAPFLLLLQNRQGGRWALQVVGEGFRVNWQSNTDIHTLAYVKQPASGELLHNTGSSAQGPVMTRWGGQDVGVGWRLKKEGIYVYLWLIHVVVQKKLTHCKAIIQLKSNKIKNILKIEYIATGFNQ